MERREVLTLGQTGERGQLGEDEEFAPLVIGEVVRQRVPGELNHRPLRDRTIISNDVDFHDRIERGLDFPAREPPALELNEGELGKAQLLVEVEPR